MWEVGGGFYPELPFKAVDLANVTNLDEMVVSFVFFCIVGVFFLFCCCCCVVNNEGCRGRDEYGSAEAREAGIEVGNVRVRKRNGNGR